MDTLQPQNDKRIPSWPRIKTRNLPSGKRSFIIDCMVDGVRNYESFPTKAEATARAWQLFRDRRDKGQAAFDLALDDRSEAAECLEMLRRYPGDHTLNDAVAFFIERKLKFQRAPTVKLGVETILSEMSDRVKRGGPGAPSHRTVENLRVRWRKFAEKYGDRQFSDIGAGEIHVWLESVTDHPETRYNFRRALTNLFNRARSRLDEAGNPVPWCSDNPAAQTLKVKRLEPDPEVFTPDEINRLLIHADAYALRPFIVLGAFCGLRVSEIERLRWQDINMTDRHIRISPTITKTRSRRSVDINETAAAWLEGYVNKAGPVVEVDGLRGRLLELRTVAKITRWPLNGLRHSYGSYAMRTMEDAGKVAMQMGNSPRVCETHYKTLVTRAEAERFWALRPPSAAGNVIPFAVAANG
jgi:integrase